MSDWEYVPAEEYCLSVRDGTHDSPKQTLTGRYLITSRHIVGNRVDLAQAYTISEKDFEEINKRSKVDIWDVLITMIGTVGEVCLVTSDPTYAIKNIGLFKSKNEILGKYLFHYLRSPAAKQHIQSLLRGTTQAYIPLAELRKFPILVPINRNLISSVVNILSPLDEKIEVNRQMNETLESMARAVFKDWFVDFGPVRAKIEGRKPPGLADDIAKLFPEKLDLEGMPEGWKIRSLGDIAESAGVSVKPSDVSDETPYIGLEHMPRRSIALDQWGKASKVTSGKLSFRRGDFLFGKLRPYFHKVGIAPINGICSTDIVVLRAKKPAASALVACCISQDDFVAYTNQTSGGTKMPRTSWELMSRYKIALSTDGIIEAFETVTQPLLDRIVSNVLESTTLASLRDLLLPKLMSGEIRLKDAEHSISGAV